MGEAVYAIDEFPDDDLLWRIEWIDGVGYNTSVPSDPLMDVCIAQLPAGETNPLSARFCTVANNVGDSVALNLAFNKKVARPIVFQKVHCKLARFRFISEPSPHRKTMKLQHFLYAITFTKAAPV